MSKLLRFDGPYAPSQIGNLDEIPLWFDFTSDKTLELKGIKEIPVRVTAKYKVRATLVLCCLANGDKLPPMLIFKETNGKLPKKLLNVYDNKKIVIKANKNGWMTTQLMKEWVEEIWRPNIIPEHGYLLIWDSFQCHQNQELINTLLEEHDTEVDIIPGGCTSILQPLDVGINKSLKNNMRNQFENWSGNKFMNQTGKLKWIFD